MSHAASPQNASAKSSSSSGPSLHRPVVATPTSVRLQPKLTINTPGDKYEQEADRVAEQVMRMPEPSLQRQCSCGKSTSNGECEECKKKKQQPKSGSIQRKSGSTLGGHTAPPIVNEVIQSPGSPLPSSTRSFMESRFGQDFGHVRIHTDQRAAESAAAVHARAYTVGSNIVFGPGESPSGDPMLLAHELTHVVQQQGQIMANMLSRQFAGEAWDDIIDVGPLDSLRALSCSGDAFDATAASGLPGQHNGKADAYRHCFWNCCMSNAIGQEQAKQVADNHELNGVGPAAENQMDQFNNAVGRSCGKTDCDQCCSSKINSGELRILGPSGLEPSSSPAPKAATPQKPPTTAPKPKAKPAPKSPSRPKGQTPPKTKPKKKQKKKKSSQPAPKKPPTPIAKNQLQTKLIVNKPGDNHQQEADRVAEQVMRMPEPSLQRQCSCGKSASDGECEECKKKKQPVSGTIQRKSASTDAGVAAPPIVNDVINSSGSLLPSSTRSFMESRFGEDFSHVRVHTDDRAAESAAAVQARAYTVGNNIVFGRGETPTSDNFLLAHELCHTLQQTGHQHGYVRRLSREDVPTGVALTSQALAASRALFAQFSAESQAGLLAVSETTAATAAVAEAEAAVVAAIEIEGTAVGLTAAGGTGLVAAGGIEVGSGGLGTPAAAVIALGALALLGAGAAVSYAYRDDIKRAWEKAAEFVAKAVDLVKKALASKSQPQTKTESNAEASTKASQNTKSNKCTDEEVKALNTEMHKACDQPRSCSNNDNCASATQKWAVGESCVRQRTELQQKCFQKGDPKYEEHMRTIAKESKVLRNCRRIMSERCFGK